VINTKKIIRYLFIFTFLFFIGLVFFFTRSPYVSNKLKGMIIPELEAVSGKKITVQKIHFNIIPFYIEAKDMEVFTDDGNAILTVNKVKGYIDLMNLLERNISKRRPEYQVYIQNTSAFIPWFPKKNTDLETKT